MSTPDLSHYWSSLHPATKPDRVNSAYASLLKTYQAYTRQIRQEYHIYPDLLYKPGRKKVLQHFLKMPAIYVTPAFRDLYETTARQNIQAELNTL